MTEYERGHRDGLNAAIDLAQKEARAEERLLVYREVWAKWVQMAPIREFAKWLALKRDGLTQ